MDSINKLSIVLILDKYGLKSSLLFLFKKIPTCSSLSHEIVNAPLLVIKNAL